MGLSANPRKTAQILHTTISDSLRALGGWNARYALIGRLASVCCASKTQKDSGKMNRQNNLNVTQQGSKANHISASFLPV